MEFAVTDPRQASRDKGRTQAAPNEDWSVERVLVVFKTHLDIGFTDFAVAVRGKYLDEFIPNALETARFLRERGGTERLVWTAGSYLISEFLDHAPADDRRAMERGIEAGDIVWHAVPFTTHTEFLDRALFKAGLAISARLDAAFGRRTCAAKMTDVPGHTRAMVPLLAEAGVQFLHIGVNPASTPPDVPPLFRWRDSASGAEITVMYNKGAYGEVSRITGTGLALAVAHTGDNHGPQSPEEIIAVFERLRRQFPAAKVEAASLNEFAEAIASRTVGLPVVTAEVGDTWIHGVASDPQKAARFRELARLHRLWSGTAAGAPPAGALDAFTRNLLLVAEHTWGLDEKTHLADFVTYGKDAFGAARATGAFRKMEESWREQRAYLDRAVEALPSGGPREQALTTLAAATPAPPDTLDLESSPPSRVEMRGPTATMTLRPGDGAVDSFATADGAALADPGHPWCVLSYRTFSPEHYRNFWRRYVVNKRITSAWSYPDFMKPGMEKCGVRDTVFRPRVTSMHTGRRGDACRAVVEAGLPEEAAATFGAPRRVTIEYEIPDATPELRVTVQWFDKDASRLPEAVVLSFFPSLTGPARPWVDKLGSRIDVRDVVRNGNRSMHAVESRAGIETDRASLTIETIDAPLVAFFEDALLNFTNRRPTGREGLHFVLFNNLWGTNFPMWNGEDAKFRFVVRWDTGRARTSAARA
ncbi:MAG: DUF5054 domain-containing protein [bacterium]